MFSLPLRNAKFNVSWFLPQINLKVCDKLLSCHTDGLNPSLSRLFSYDREKKCYDLIIVGGGIVGLAVAQELITRRPSLSIALVEKEKRLAAHQSGHNSGVIHAGVYYKPGSLRAKLCVEGLHRTYEYCDKHNIPYKKCGKLIVATNDFEVTCLNDLYQRAVENCVPDVRMVSANEIKRIEPYCKGKQAIHSPHTGIVSWAEVARKYGSEFQRMKGDIYLNFEVTSFEKSEDPKSEYPIIVCSQRISEKRCLSTAYVLTCGGLYSDKLAEMTGGGVDPKIIPFRGEYLKLKSGKEYLCKGNIYPVPDPRFPFLGVHFTPKINGCVWLGPNAMLAFKREGYRFWDINFGELRETLMYRGFQKFMMKYFSSILEETKKSFIRKYQIAELKKYIPEIEADDIESGPSGVRAQAMSSEGELIEDFLFSGKERILHCRNAPSPGATSSLAIGRELADRVEKEFNL